MSLIRDLFGPGSANPAENPEKRLTGGLLLSILEEFGINLGVGTKSGKSITPATALRFVAVYRAVTLISGQIGSLPLKVFDDEKEEEVVSVITTPHPGMTEFEFRETMAGHLGTWGNFDAFKVRSTQSGEVQELWPYMPGRTSYRLERPSEQNPSGRLYDITNDAGAVVSTLTDNEVFHVPLFSLNGFVGLSPIGLAREAIASALSAEEFANRLWKSGSLMSGFLTTPQRLQEEKAKTLKARWQERVGGLDKAWEVAVLDSGADFKPLTLPPNDAQFLENRKFQVDEIARLYGLPPHLLSQQERQTSWGTGIEQNNIGFVVYTLDPVWLTRIEQRFTLLVPSGNKAEFQVQGLLRGDSAQRSAFYTALFNMGALNPNEIRDLENLPAREGGDEYFDPTTQAPVSEPPIDEEIEDDEDDDDDD